MTRFKDFGAPVVASNIEPPTFALYGESFTCVPEIQGSLLLSLVGNSDNSSASASASIITDFFNEVLVEESLVRFNALINSKDKIVKIDTLGEIVAWLVEEYSGRPEGQPEA